MVTLLIKWVISAAALLITAYFVPGFKVQRFKPALIAAAVVGVFNIFLGSILHLLALPLTILTLGLFAFVVNAVVLKASTAFVDGFDIENWGSAIVGAVVLAIVSGLLHWFLV